jgi:hypothetical protein
LEKLLNAGLVDGEMVALSTDARDRWLALQSRPWTVKDIRTGNEWKELFELCDDLISKLI